MERKRVSVETALSALTPRVFFKLKPRFIKQVSLWDKASLNQILSRSMDTEMNIRYGSGPAELLCSRLLFGVTYFASKRAR
jgi:DNA polymerase III delta subunit